MMVIRGTIGPGTGTGDVARDNNIVPAEQCVWLQAVDSTGGYNVTDVEIVKGVGSLLIAGNTFNGTTPVPITNAQLGFIGKSGRFVAIA